MGQVLQFPSGDQSVRSISSDPARVGIVIELFAAKRRTALDLLEHGTPREAAAVYLRALADSLGAPGPYVGIDRELRAAHERRK